MEQSKYIHLLRNLIIKNEGAAVTEGYILYIGYFDSGVIVLLKISERLAGLTIEEYSFNPEKLKNIPKPLVNESIFNLIKCPGQVVITTNGFFERFLAVIAEEIA